MTDREAYDELCAYTLTHRDPAFIHQHVVDVFAAQTANEETKPMSVAFALVGLYLHVERHFSGRQVQRAHQYLARYSRTWPAFALPQDRGSISVADILAQPIGAKRDAAIQAWCASVWNAYRDSRQAIADLVLSYGQALDASARKG